MTQPARTRIAPSPTGDPHVGTAYVAVFNKALAMQTGGQFVLRIEDTDRERSTAASEAAIFRSLAWLGLGWDEGPDVGGPHGPYRQSERLDIYHDHVKRMVDAGTAYPCFCTPDELAAMRQRQKEAKQPPRYDGTWRDAPKAKVDEWLRAGKPHVVRLRVPNEGSTTFTDEVRGAITFENANIDDQVLLKGDGFPTYHLANVVDDHLMGITHVIRAEEWISSVPKHVFIYDALGYPMPKLAHVPLLRNKDKSKISKRKNPVSIDWYTEKGYLPEAIVNFLALLGYSLESGEEIFDFATLVEQFSIDRINPSAAPVFNLEKLDWLNGEYVRAMSLDALAERILAFGYPADRADMLRRFLPIVQERIKTFDEVAPMTDFFFADPTDYDPELLVPKKCDRAFAREALRGFADRLPALDAAPTGADYEAAVDALATEREWKRGNVFMCLRVAVTGSKQTPPLVESMEILGRDAVARRLEHAITRLGETA